MDLHDRFVAEEAIPRAERGLNMVGVRRIAAGASSGGAWASTSALARPDLFDAAIAMSPAVRGANLAGLTPGRAQRYFIVAGIFEGMGNARLAYDAVAGKADACLLEGVDGHSPTLQRAFLPLALRAALKSPYGCPTWSPAEAGSH